MGGTFEAFQTAAGIREYLDEIGYHDTKITLFDPEASEIEKSFGVGLSEVINNMLREKRISVIMNTKSFRLQGVNNVDVIYF